MTYRVPLELVTRVNGSYNDGGTTYKFIFDFFKKVVDIGHKDAILST